jgi:hypothetical protein
MTSYPAAQAATSTAGARSVRLRDVRGFWRVLLAVLAPLPLLAKGVYYLIVPFPGGAGFEETVTASAAHRDLLGPLLALDVVFVGLLVPATVAVIWVSRRGAPVLTTIGALLALLGSFAGITILGGALTPARATVEYGLDVTAMAAFDQAAQNEPLVLVAGLLFVVGIVFGLGLLGVALWRSHGAPAWTGIALLAGAATHPFVPGPVAQGVGLLVAAVGFAGASYALLRMSNDEFDLQPRLSGT